MKVGTLILSLIVGMFFLHEAMAQKAVKSVTGKPNIIFVLVDDMGWGDLECNWNQQKLNGRQIRRENELKTPALSTIAKEGVQLRRHYTAAPVCAPARASLMLGVHQGHSRNVRNNRFDRPIEDSHTLGSMLKEAGYDTAAIGKWGIGGGGESKVPMTAGPHQRGFDYFYGLLDHLAGHFHYPSECRDVYEYDGKDWKNIKNDVPKTAYSTDLFGARAKQWIIDQQKSARSTQRPFFLYLALPAPHASLAVPAVPYPKGLGLKGGLQWVEKEGVCSANTAFDKEAEKGKDKWIYPEHRKFDKEVARRHATMIRRVDDYMADLLKLLKDLKIDNNTLIVFTSDNGPHDEAGSDHGHNHGAQDPRFFKSYGMMDGIKRDCWEGGIRVPTLVRWPARIPKGRISMELGQFHDWMATLADAAGVPVPARSDGVSLMPMLTGKGKSAEGTVYVEYNGPGQTPGYDDFLDNHKKRGRGQQQVVYVGGLKGIRRQVSSADQNFMIFDTLKDPQESENLAAKYPEIQEKMKAKALWGRRACKEAGTIFDKAIVPSVELPNSAKKGLNWVVYKGQFPWVPDFRKMKKSPHAQGGVEGLKFIGIPMVNNVGVELSGFVNVPNDGEYTFYLTTDKGEGTKAFVRLHDMELLDADKNYVSGTMVDSTLGGVSLPINLKAGWHPIRIGYVCKETSAPGLKLEWSISGQAKKEIPAEAYMSAE